MGSVMCLVHKSLKSGWGCVVVWGEGWEVGLKGGSGGHSPGPVLACGLINPSPGGLLGRGVVVTRKRLRVVRTLWWAVPLP